MGFEDVAGASSLVLHSAFASAREQCRLSTSCLMLQTAVRIAAESVADYPVPSITLCLGFACCLPSLKRLVSWQSPFRSTMPQPGPQECLICRLKP